MPHKLSYVGYTSSRSGSCCATDDFNIAGLLPLYSTVRRPFSNSAVHTTWLSMIHRKNRHLTMLSVIHNVSKRRRSTLSRDAKIVA